MAREWDESDVRIRPNKHGSRPRTKERPKHKNAAIGRIVAVDRGRYTAVVDENSIGERVVVAARASELRRQAVVVGDFVALVGDVSGEPDTLARLVRIEPRTTLLRRSADDSDPVERAVVANADQMVIVVAAMHPEPRTGFIDRALVAAYDAGIEPVLLITKADLRHPEALLEHYRLLHVPVVLSRSAEQEAQESQDARAASVPTPAGPGEETELPLPLAVDAIRELRALLQGKVSVLLGHSGVGKSTMVNALTGAGRATGGVNAVTGRGRHTSSSAVALELTGAGPGSWIIDTPGIRSFGLALVDPDRILAAFPDLEPGSEDCPRGCTHSSTEPECGLDPWVADGNAGPGGAVRLSSFRGLLQAVSSTGTNAF